MNAIRELTGWIKEHKPTAIFFALIFVGIAVYTGLDRMPIKWAIGITCFVFLCWTLVYKMDKPTVIILIAALLGGNLEIKAAEPNQPQAGGVAVAGVVVVVGGVAVYLLVKTCQKLFNKPPKPENTNEVWAVSAPDDYAASWTYSSFGSCYMPGQFQAASDQSGTPALMEITMNVDWEGQVTTQIAPINPDDNYTELAGFKNLLAANGLPFYDHGFNQKAYGRNGRPSTEAEVPIRFDELTRTIDVSNGGPSSAIVLERSFDLTTWEAISRTQVGFGQSLRFRDLTLSSQAFYRVSVQ